MTPDTTYNGWSNYATWRVNLEIWDNDTMYKDLDPFESIHELAYYLRDTTEDIVSDYGDTQGLVLDYALAFLQDVDFFEIAERIASDYPSLVKNI